MLTSFFLHSSGAGCTKSTSTSSPLSCLWVFNAHCLLRITIDIFECEKSKQRKEKQQNNRLSTLGISWSRVCQLHCSFFDYCCRVLTAPNETVCCLLPLTLTVYEVRFMYYTLRAIPGHNGNLYQLPFFVSSLEESVGWKQNSYGLGDLKISKLCLHTTQNFSLSPICECHKLQTILYCATVAFIAEELINLETIAR